jgi:hypothetical protein
MKCHLFVNAFKDEWGLHFVDVVQQGGHKGKARSIKEVLGIAKKRLEAAREGKPTQLEECKCNKPSREPECVCTAI